MIPMVLAPETHDTVLNASILNAIKNTKVYFVENLKTARRFISSLKLGVVIDELTFYEIDNYRKSEELYTLLWNTKEDIGILSESGCPGVADPGAKVVELAHDIGREIQPLVGPNSILLALMASGFNGQSFAFNGYLPVEEKEKEKKIKQFEAWAKQNKQTQIFIETPYRNKQLLATFLKVLKPETRICIACNLTAEDQYIKSADVAWFRRQDGLPDIHKKPCIFLLI
jgi:16S rRNA (cytidine1402-2'-O)-methyltransferase